MKRELFINYMYIVVDVFFLNLWRHSMVENGLHYGVNLVARTATLVGN